MMAEKYKLQDIVNFAPKSKLNARDGASDGEYPFFTSSKTVVKRHENSQYKGTAIIIGTGGTANVHFSSLPFSTTSHCTVLYAKDENRVNIKYIYYFLISNIHILEQGFRGVGLRNLPKGYIENVEIPIPPIDHQKEIVTILDKIQLLINKRNESAENLDKLLLSTYLNMFGEKNSDFQNWNDVPISDYKKNTHRSVRTGPFGSSLKHEMFKESGNVLVLGIDNVVDNIFRLGKKRYLTNDEYTNFRNYTVHTRDVVITIMGTVGRSAVIPENIGLAINTKHLAAITVDDTKCNPYYLSFSIHSNPYVQYQLKARTRGAVMDGLNLSIIKQLKIKNAPIDLQNDFEKIYLKIQGYKDLLLDSKQQMEFLLKSLFQRSFRSKDVLDIKIELDTIINNIDINVPNIETISKDFIYLQSFIDRITSQEFDDMEQYEKSRLILLQLLKNESLKQEYNPVSKSIRLIQQ